MAIKMTEWAINKQVSESFIIGDPEGINRVRRNYSESELVKYSERKKGSTDFKDAEVLIHLDSFALGDTICFSSFLIPFIEYHSPRKIYVTTFFPHLFDNNNPTGITFIPADSASFVEVDVHINVGYEKERVSHTIGGLFFAVRETMHLPQNINPQRPPLKERGLKRDPNKIVIAPESVKKIARWDYHGGWQKVVDFLNLNNFSVTNISHENYLELKDVNSSNGIDDIEVAINHIAESRIFIGLSSGLSWVAWAYGIPVVMISGFTKAHNEFPCYRVSSEFGCGGCYNIIPQIKNPCPIFYGTDRMHECHKLIYPAMVIEKTIQALKENHVE
jgi:autotransporter strand-loop-strand O-heptosyltransferase